jgi:hypothetical protein
MAKRQNRKKVGWLNAQMVEWQKCGITEWPNGEMVESKHSDKTNW